MFHLIESKTHQVNKKQILLLFYIMFVSEQNALDDINYDEIIDNFAELKTRNIIFK